MLNRHHLPLLVSLTLASLLLALPVPSPAADDQTAAGRAGSTVTQEQIDILTEMLCA